MKKTLIILSLVLITPLFLFSQEKSFLYNFPKNWKAGASGGVSYLTFELKKNFQQATMDMNSMPDASFSLFMNKRFNKHLEAGIEFEKCYFNGFKNSSGNVNWLVYDQTFNNEESRFLSTPVYYNTDISTWYLNFVYNFMNIYSWKSNFLNVNLYLKAGLGLSLIAVELGYKNQLDYTLSNLESPLFAKGHKNQSPRDAYGTFHLGGGLNYYFSKRWSATAEVNMLFVSADYLDGVHNFTVTHNSDGSVNYSRIGVFDTVGELKIGVAYHFNLVRTDKTRYAKWIAKNDQFRNDFYVDKKFNRIIKPVNPYSDKDLMKTLRKRKGGWFW